MSDTAELTRLRERALDRLRPLLFGLVIGAPARHQLQRADSFEAIRSDVKSGAVSDLVARTRLAALSPGRANPKKGK